MFYIKILCGFYLNQKNIMSSIINNVTVINLLQDLSIPTDNTSSSLIQMATANSRYLKELKLNVAASLNSQHLSRKEAYLLALSIAVNEKNNILITAFEKLSEKEGATIEEIAETHACASLMSVNNIFYRFRHFMHENEFYNKQPLGLRMGLMLNPVMGKGLFELMSLVISAVNGCEKCVSSHEHSVKEQGATEARIFDSIKLAAVIKGLCVVI